MRSRLDVTDWRKMMNTRSIGRLVLALGFSAGMLGSRLAVADLLYSTGFESSDGFTLNSALPSAPTLPSDWYRLDGATTTTPPIVDINSTNHGGSQGLRIVNQGPNVDQSDPDSNTFVQSPVINMPGTSGLIASNKAYVSIKWDMRVVDAPDSADDSTYIGLDVYDASGNAITTVGREVIGGTPALIGLNDSGVDFTVLDFAPASDLWASYELKLDFVLQKYQLFVDNVAAGSARPFVPGAEDSLDINFTDVGRGLDTAYFDNFSVTAVPEPSALAGALVLGMVARRRKV